MRSTFCCFLSEINIFAVTHQPKINILTAFNAKSTFLSLHIAWNQHFAVFQVKSSNLLSRIDVTTNMSFCIRNIWKKKQTLAKKIQDIVYSAFTETRASQTMKTNQMPELKQYVPTFSNPANQMSCTKQWNLNLFVVIFATLVSVNKLSKLKPLELSRSIKKIIIIVLLYFRFYIYNCDKFIRMTVFHCERTATQIVIFMVVG